MGSTLREQLANLPVPTLVTVLRVNVPLNDGLAAYAKASELIRDWWNEKAAPYDVLLDSYDRDFTFSRSGFKADYARTDDSFALAMEEPDSGIEERSWIVNIALKLEDEKSSFTLRASYRQPYNLQSRPEPRAPRFLRQIIEEVGAFDEWPLTSESQVIDAAGLPYLMDFLESGNRTLPVVAISEDVETGLTLADPDKIARFLAGTAHVVRLNRESSWGLSSQWGAEWSVYLGAIRCYLPKFNRRDDKSRHRLWLPESIYRLNANSRNGFINAAIGHIFTQITAQFEAWPLLTPSAVRRQFEGSYRQVAALSTTLDETPTGDLVFLDGKTELASDQIAVQPQSAFDSAVTPTDEFAKLKDSYQELFKRFERHEEVVQKLENDLEQERAARAETERTLGETKAELEMFTEEYQQLERQKAIAFGDISKEQSEALRPLWQNFSGLFTAMQTVAIKFRRMEQDSDLLAERERNLASANRTILNQKATIDSLNRRNSTQDTDRTNTHNIPRETILEVIPQLAKKQLPLVAILEALSVIFPDRITVLESAFESAEESNTFQYGEQAFDLLWRLATSYWEEVQTKGDTEARKLFGTKSYSAKERTVLTKCGKDRRTFEYQGKQIHMDKHLKIGTADNPSDTLRIHFEWLADEKRIIIGHCGKHLDF